MKAVLFATDDIQPGKRLFDYALQFCCKMKTELIILQILPPRTYQGIVQTLKNGLEKTQSRIESALTAATLAEAGEPESAKAVLRAGKQNIARLLPEQDETCPLRCIEQKIGEPDLEIYAFLQANPGIVLTFYDGTRDKSQKTNRQGDFKLWERVPEKLGIPFVMRPESIINTCSES